MSEGLRFLREREVASLTGLSRVRRWELERLGRFPRRVKLSVHAVGWVESEIRDWMRERIDARSRAARASDPR